MTQTTVQHNPLVLVNNNKEEGTTRLLEAIPIVGVVTCDGPQICSDMTPILNSLMTISPGSSYEMEKHHHVRPAARWRTPISSAPELMTRTVAPHQETTAKCRSKMVHPKKSRICTHR